MKETKPTVVAVGEILWDVFPDRRCFGGAPANFACALSELSRQRVDVHLLSGVGRDELGSKALKELRSHGVLTDLVSEQEQPTGRVDVKIKSDGSADYVFAENVAWDDLQWSDDIGQVATNAAAVCFGSLGQRSQSSRETIQRFVKSTSLDCLRIFDINLRFPHVNEDAIRASLELCNLLKLNEEELPYLADLLGWQGNENQLLKSLMDEFELQLVALTKGPGGAVLSNGTDFVHIPVVPSRVADTVGAGDAFTATLALGILKQRILSDDPNPTKLELGSLGEIANRVAAYVCGQPGATPSFPAELTEAIWSL